ncbi:MAG TPA: glycosyltransferase family 4 protein, partial [Dehalococcoidia bacterium]|nr:glycosyltransferase family 4 protein [Dehalococcoidia bacterium]
RRRCRHPAGASAAGQRDSKPLMRIVLVNYEYPPLGGGAASATRHLASQWVRLGHGVHLVTSAFDNLPRQQTEDGLEIARLPVIRKRASGSTATEQASFVLSGLIHMPFLVRRWKPDIACLLFAVPSGPLGLLTKVTNRLPYVVSLQGMDVPGFPAPDVVRYHPWIKPVVRIVLRHADGIVAISDGLKALAEPLAARRPISVIPFGIDRTEFYPAETPLPAPPLHLLFVGRLVEQKALPVLLEAMSLVRNSGRDARLTIVGDGPRRAACEALVADMALQEHVEFAGWRGRPEVPEFFRRAHVFVLPSYVESFGQVMLEAMASGLPVVTTHLSNMAGLIQQESNGLLVPAGDARALADAIGRLAADEPFRLRLAERSRDDARAYSWESVAAQYLELFEAALGRRQPTGTPA